LLTAGLTLVRDSLQGDTGTVAGLFKATFSLLLVTHYQTITFHFLLLPRLIWRTFAARLKMRLWK
jgi:tryptophan-rich sensory protein